MLEKVFGSRIDWISQHSVFPEYFRQQFYETGNLFPEFAANIGGGQNIYNFSYYGLYSPLLYPAYFLTFIKMSDYIIAISILCLGADVLLLYRWLRGNDVSKANSMLTSLLFLFACPMIFHSYSQIMFVNYMPFLLLGFLGVDRYFRKNKGGLLALSVFLMIMTSFYFSVGGILTLVIYGVFRYLSVQETCGKKTDIKDFLLAGIRFCAPVFTGVLMSGILLVPTAAALLGGERGAGKTVSLANLILPNLRSFHLLYNAYGIGLTTLIVTVLFTGLTYGKWREKYLSIVCLIVLSVPFFQYLLNGGLYVRGKVLIPFVPLLCYLIAMYLEKQRRREIPFLPGIVPFLLTFVLIWIGVKNGAVVHEAERLLADAGIMIFCGLIFYAVRREKILIVLPIVFLAIYGFDLNINSNEMVNKDFYAHVTDENYKKLSEALLSKEKGFYRMEQAGTLEEDAANLNRILSMEQYISSVYSSTYHEAYQEFRKETFQIEQPYRNILMQAGAKNSIFQKLMGIKYILSEKEIPGYEKIGEDIYENKDVYPVIYAADRLISENEYRKLKFPYNQTAFLDFAIADEADSGEGWKEQLTSKIKKIDIGWKGGRVQTEQPLIQKLTFAQAEKGDMILIQFEVKNHRPLEDIFVTIGGVCNKLTARNHVYYNENRLFTYAITLKEGQTQLQVELGKGDYEILNLKSYLWKDPGKESLCRSVFILDKEATKGNRIVGTVDGEREELLITSIPYDENFEIFIDGQKTPYEKVNLSFLGIRSEEGPHDIEIVYHAPGLRTGKAISFLGFVCYGLLCFGSIREPWRKKLTGRKATKM